MAYRSFQLALAIAWKFNGPQGVCTSDGYLTKWPESLGEWPADAQQQTWVDEYTAYLASTKCKDDELQQSLDRGDEKAIKTIATMLIQKGMCTLAELRQVYRSL